MEKVILGLYARLVLLQNELKAPKSQMNKFGGYKYRNNEDILEAVKPLLLKYDFTLVLSDDVVMIGERYYVKVTAKLIDTVEGLWIENSALAREEETKKGMDASQITGASSSYARKYALNGLFAIDDTKDSDTTNDGKEEKPTVKVNELGVSSKAQEEIAKARAKKVETPKVEAKPLVNLPPIDEEPNEEPQVVFSQEDLDDNSNINSEDRDIIANLLNKLPMERQIAFLDKYLKVIKGYPSINSIQYKDYKEIKSQLEKAVGQKKA